MNNVGKDISVGLMFIVGIFCFLSGTFILSTVVFAMAAVFSNLHFSTGKQEEIKQTF